MDPPSYGRGANGEVWKLEDCIFDLVKECAKVLTDNPLFFLINSYTTGLQPQVIDNILTLCLSDFKGQSEAYEVGLPTDEGIILPCGCSGLWTGKVNKTKK
jgi:23S rRNA (cytosine1962-C5)-methyltransferase